MGKRKNNSESSVSPKKEKKASKFGTVPVKAEKRPAAESSDSEQEEDEEEQLTHVELEETRNEDEPTNFEPDAFRLLCESFADYVQSKNFTVTNVHNMEKVAAEWISARNEIIDARLFTTDYRMYLKKAIRFRNFQLNDSNAALLTFLNGEKVLTEFSSMPEKPPTKVQLYVKKNNLEFKGINGNTMKTIYKNIHDNPTGSQEVDEILLEMNKQYIPKLQEFLDSHPNLTEEQQKHISNKIKALDKKHNPKAAAPKTPKKKSAPRKEETAFTVFCRSKNDKYRDLSDDDRERKLAKKFAKLSAEARDILESLAINL